MEDWRGVVDQIVGCNRSGHQKPPKLSQVAFSFAVSLQLRYEEGPIWTKVAPQPAAYQSVFLLHNRI